MIKYYFGVSSISLSVFIRSDKKDNMQVKCTIYFSQYASYISISYRNSLHQTPSLSTRTIYLYLPPIFCECCQLITLVFLILNFTLTFYLRNTAATRGVSPSLLKTNRKTLFSSLHFCYMLISEITN